MYYTYILFSETTGKLYIGQTNNLEVRIKRHNAGKNFSTKSGSPWELIFSKSFNTRSEAMKYEKYLKSIKNNIYLMNKIKLGDL